MKKTGLRNKIILNIAADFRKIIIHYYSFFAALDTTTFNYSQLNQNNHHNE